MRRVCWKPMLLAVLLLAPPGCHGQPPAASDGSVAAPAKTYKSVRRPAVAGLFYPARSQELTRSVDGLLDGVKTEPIKGLRALVCPHAGYEFSGPVAAVSYKQLAVRDFSTVIVLGPSHYAAFSGAFISPVDAYETPLGTIPLSPLAKQLATQAPFTSKTDCEVQRPAWWQRAPKEVPPFGEDAPDTWEHSLEVQLPFLQRTLKKFSIVPVVFGDVAPKQVAEKLLPLLDDATLIVASSDLSHYHPYEDANRRDKQCVDAICRLQADRITGMDACGHQPVSALIEIARRKGWKAKLLDYRNSGDTSGQQAGVVGYAAIAFYQPDGAPAAPPTKPSSNERAGKGDTHATRGEAAAPATNEYTADDRRFLLALARQSVAAAVAGGKAPGTVPIFVAGTDAIAVVGHKNGTVPLDQAEVAAKFHASRACFVTLTKHGELRGCIGTIFPREELRRAVLHSARSAATEDFRFPPVTSRELDELRVEISVLTVPKRLEFSSPQALLAKLRPGIDGVVLSLGARHATFLPQVWEQLPAKATFLDELCRKAGLPESAWMDPDIKVLVYQVEAFHER